MVKPIIKGLHYRKVTLYGHVLPDPPLPPRPLHTAVGTIPAPLLASSVSLSSNSFLTTQLIGLCVNVTSLELYVVPQPGKTVNHLLSADCSAGTTTWSMSSPASLVQTHTLVLPVMDTSQEGREER